MVMRNPDFAIRLPQLTDECECGAIPILTEMEKATRVFAARTHMARVGAMSGRSIRDCGDFAAAHSSDVEMQAAVMHAASPPYNLRRLVSGPGR